MTASLALIRTEARTTRGGVLLSRLFDVLFCFYVFTTIFLPSGSIYGVNLKLPLYFLVIPLAIRKFLYRRSSYLSLALMLAVPALLAFWLLQGLTSAFAASGAIRQYMDLVLTLLTCWLVFVFCGDQEMGRLRFLRLVLNCELATCLFKAAIILYALVRGVPVVEVVNAVGLAFNVTLMTMDLGALFGRVQFVSDALIPICIYIVVRYRHRLELSSPYAVAAILLLFTSVIFSFSRYFWGFTAVAFVIGVLLGKRDRFKAYLLICMGGVVLASLPVLSALYQYRFSDAVAGSSDADRTAQSKALQDFFWDSPLMGHGLGSYTNLVIRSTDNEAGRYGYEMQLLALAGQTGAVGITFFLVLLLWYYRRIFKRGLLPMSDRLGLGTLILIWLAAGLYNPLLASPVASVSYACLATMSALRKETSAAIGKCELVADTGTA